MAFDDFIDSAPSVAGCAGTAVAAVAYWPARILLAMQATIISDPAQIHHVGNRHTALAGKAELAGTEFGQAVEKVSVDWNAKDKQAFVQQNVQPYKDALNKTSEMHKGISAAMNALAKVFQDLGRFSMGIGTLLAGCALEFFGLILFPGVGEAVEEALAAMTETAAAGFRGILVRLGVLLTKAARLMVSVKGILAGTLFGGISTYSSLSGQKPQLASSASTAPGTGPNWPGVTPSPVTPSP